MKKETHPYANERTSDIMIGLPDGLTIPFIAVSGMCGAVAGNTTIFATGLIVTCAGAGAIGLGRYFASHPHHAHHRVHDIGLSTEVADAITQDHAQEKSRWDEFSEQFDLDFNKPDPIQIRKSALNTSLAYVMGGLIPVLPFLFSGSLQGLQWSAAVTLPSLFISGYFKGKNIGINAWGEAFRLTLTGACAAAAAFFAIRLLFQG